MTKKRKTVSPAEVFRGDTVVQKTEAMARGMKAIAASSEKIKAIAASSNKMASIQRRARQSLEFAQQIAEGTQRWVDMHNALFGIAGKCTELFPTEAARTAFTKTKQHGEIMALMDDLREEHGDEPSVAELAATANGNISLRLPRTLHAALLAESKAEDVSLNQLCLAKLAVQLRAVV